MESRIAGAETGVQNVNQPEFEEAVLESETPTIVDFYAAWWGPCRIVSPIIESLSKEHTGRVSFF
jgi:thioredoxin 1